MKNQTLGEMIATLRKEKSMTQIELASQMNVTDKAVSKWERDLSCPDINSLPKLAEILGISIDDLMKGKASPTMNTSKKIKQLVILILKAITLAMGVCVIVLSSMNQIDSRTSSLFLGIGIVCTGILLLNTRIQE